MKLMIISDIHGSYLDLKKVLDIFEEEKMDKLVILGDILYHGPRNDLPEGYAPKKVIPLLNLYRDKIIAVRGNCDAEVDQMVLDFPMRADFLELFIDNYRMFLTHGHIYNEDNMPLLNEGDIFLHGHFHKPILKNEKGIFILNPNSISLPKEGEKSYLVYENEEFSLYTLQKRKITSLKLKK